MCILILFHAKGAQGDVGPQGPLHPLVNNALATEAGVAALDAAMGKTLQDHIDTINSNLSNEPSVGISFLSSSNLYVSKSYGIVSYNGTNPGAGHMYAG